MSSRGGGTLRGLVWLLVPLLVIGFGVPLGLAAGDPLRDLQYGLARVQVEEAWARSRGAGVVIAIIDTGIHLRHEDLRDKIVPGRDFVDDDDHPQDRNGHGTHVAGVAAASTDNGLGISGTAPAAMLMPLRVLDGEGTGVESDVAATIRFAVLRSQERGFRLVVNLSLTDLKVEGSVASRDIQAAIREAWFSGAVIVAAVGNENLPHTDYPAAGPNVLAVGATDEHDRRAAFSNRGPLVVAPGEGIVSTFWDPKTPNDDAVYAAGSGTSMAAPMVSGLAALLLSTGLTNEQAVARIIETADDLGEPGFDDDFGYGRINAARALGLIGPAPVGVPSPTEVSGDRGTDGRFERVGEVGDGRSPGAAPPLRGEPAARTQVATLAAILVLVAFIAIRWYTEAGSTQTDTDQDVSWEV